MIRFVILFCLSALFTALSGQENIRISKPVLSYSNNILTIKYDITGCGSGEYIDIRLIILNSKGDSIKPVYVTGDIGNMVNCGLGKTIVWNVERDNAKINEDIQVFLTGKKFVPVVSNINTGGPKKITRGNVLLSSIFVPGLGEKKASGKSCYFVFSGLVYGGLGTSLFLNLKSKQLKEDYLAASGTVRDDLFNKWQKNYDMSTFCIYGAAGIWAVNFIWSAIIPIKENPLKKMNVTLTSSRQNEFLISTRWSF